MSSDIKKILVRARALISVPARMTKQAYALDDAGATCTPKSSSAVCWCPEGAIYASDDVPESISHIQVLRMSEVQFSAEAGWRAIYFLERVAEAKKRDLTQTLGFIPQLRFVIEPLSHQHIMDLFDEGVAACDR